MSFAIALAGGGVRGAYQIGALKALLEMGIEISAVCGTSIGSINGAVFAQGDMDKAEELWRGIDIKSMFDFSKSIFRNKGLDVTPLRELLLEIVDEERLRASKIDFGLTAFSLTDRRSMKLFSEDIPQGKIVDYLLASSCFPGFKTVEIDGIDFIDGGVADNMPTSMLIDRGYRDIIAIDIGGPGHVVNVDTTGINLITVKNHEKPVGLFEFDNEKIERSMQLGYLDTYKTFGKLQGWRYYFENSEYAILRSRYSQSIIKGLEYCAQLFGIENSRAYQAQEFVDTIMEKHEQASEHYNVIKESLLKMNLPELLKNWKKEEGLKQGVILPFLIALSKEGKGAVSLRMLKRLAGKELLAAGSLMYLSPPQNTQ